MEGEEEPKRAGEAVSSPLLTFLTYTKMEEVADKLKLLNYETGFCKQLKFKPFFRHYFAESVNPGEQFHTFSNLAVWLINFQKGKHIDQPQEYDDPNATVATIISEAKHMDVPVNFAPAKLKSGAGEQVVDLLNGLTGRALESKGFVFKSPVYHEDGAEEEVIQEESSELSLSKMDEELMADNEGADSDDEGPVYLDLTGIKQSGDVDTAASLTEALESTVDAQEWRLEVERVLPSLKVHVRQDNRDWRAHYEQMHAHNTGIESNLSETKVYLDKLHQEISKTLEKIGSREKYVNNQLDGPIQEFRISQDQLSEVREKYKTASGSVNDLARELAQVSEELESIKAEMDDKGTSMTDSGPMVKIKQSLTRLKSESTQMEVRIGVIEHTLLEAKFKTKSAIKRQMNATAFDNLF